MLLRGGGGVKCTCDSGLPAGLSGAQRGGGGGGGGAEAVLMPAAVCSYTREPRN